jgi:hypothetical protein
MAATTLTPANVKMIRRLLARWPPSDVVYQLRRPFPGLSIRERAGLVERITGRPMTSWRAASALRKKKRAPEKKKPSRARRAPSS